MIRSIEEIAEELRSYPDVERSAALMDVLMSARDAAGETTGVTVPGPGRESS